MSDAPKPIPILEAIDAARKALADLLACLDDTIHRRDALWNIDDVANFLGLSTRAVRSLVQRDKDFPPPIELSEKAHRWFPADVARYARNKQRSNGEPQ